MRKIILLIGLIFISTIGSGQQGDKSNQNKNQQIIRLAQTLQQKLDPSYQEKWNKEYDERIKRQKEETEERDRRFKEWMNELRVKRGYHPKLHAYLAEMMVKCKIVCKNFFGNYIMYA